MELQPKLVREIKANILIDHSQFVLFDYFSDEVSLSNLSGPRDSNWIAYSGRGGVSFHAADNALSAAVRVQIWGTLPEKRSDVANVFEGTFSTPSGRVMLACLIASPSDVPVELLGPGEYAVRAWPAPEYDVVVPDSVTMEAQGWKIQVAPSSSR